MSARRSRAGYRMAREANERAAIGRGFDRVRVRLGARNVPAVIGQAAELPARADAELVTRNRHGIERTTANAQLAEPDMGATPTPWGANACASMKGGSRRAIQQTPYSPEGEPRSPIVDAGPLHMHPPASGSELAPSARLWVAREASARDEALTTPTRPGFPTIAIRWRRASGGGWRESSKRSSASVGVGARFRGIAITRIGAGARALAVECDHAVGGPLGTPFTGIGREPLGRRVVARAVRQGG